MTIASGRAVGHGEHRDEEVGGADAAIAADGERRDRRGPTNSTSAAGAMPIIVLPAVSKLAVSVNGMPTRSAAARRGAHLLQRRHGLDPDDVGAALLQPLDLLDEDVDRLVLGERPERRQEVAGRPDRAGDDHRPAGGIGDRACILGRKPASSRVRSCRLCSARRRRLQPNELVRMMSAPASTKLWCSARMRSGWVSFHRSGASPEVRPMLNRLVPVAPSARSTGRGRGGR